MEAIEVQKKRLLDAEGYKYHFSRMVFFHRSQKKMFSREFIDDHTVAQIRQAMQNPKTRDWQFYFNQQLSDAAKQEILSEFGK